jgi:hypothetical protein
MDSWLLIEAMRFDVSWSRDTAASNAIFSDKTRQDKSQNKTRENKTITKQKGKMQDARQD